MKILIAGDGKVGMALTHELVREGHDVTVIDSNMNALRMDLGRYDVMTVNGNAAALNTLREAGVEQSELLIAATSADETNILCCLTARSLNKNLHTIARVRNPEYTEQLFTMREYLGLSLSINPEFSAAREIFRLLQFPGFLRRETFAKGRVEIVELKIPEGASLQNVALNNLYKIAGVKVLVCAVSRQGKVEIPNGSYVLRAGDHVYVTARAINLAQLIKNLKIETQKIRHVILVGGGRISYYLAELLLGTGVRVKIIEKDPDRAARLAELLPKASIVLGDGSMQSLLESEGVYGADALVTLTGMDEENIVISMFAHTVGVRKVITKVNRQEFSYIFNDMIGSVVSPKELCSSEIVRYVRAMQKQTGQVITLHRIANEGAEALEFNVDDEVQWCNTPLKDVPLKQGVLISCITHKGKTVIPDGSSVFQKGDTVIAVVTSGRVIQQMNDIFEE